MNLFIDLFVQLSLDNRENWYDTPIGKDPLMNQENLQIMEFLLSSKFTCGDKQVVSVTKHNAFTYWLQTAGC